jgi:GntR family transcriptional repressor for pyruvate dehydrogenase complex
MRTFNSVKSGKISELVAQQIKNAILKGTMKPGYKLPPERVLVKEFQASRVSIREAVKKVEASGLLKIKPGSGVFVSEVSSKPISDSLASILRMQRISINELTEARIILEPYIAKLAAEKITVEDLEKLENNIHETSKIVESNKPSPAQNIEFHSLVAGAAQNQVIALTMKTLLDVVKEMTLEITNDFQKRAEISRHALACHKKILKAFREKDSQRVYELMLKDIIQVQSGLKIVTSRPR